ncbi:MAG: beta-ketoacyl-ACP synthase III [Thermovirgaceae bacterium]|nr:beta-ketoacyl-ACP synthase III [Thermovirgaceae bacterium]
MTLKFAVPVALLGTGMYVPERVVTNDELTKMVETSDEWIIERTGIKERHIASEGEVTSQFAAKAGMEALRAAGITPEELDMIIVATNSPDMLFPGVGPLVQGMIKATKAGACDVQAGCTGCVYALVLASAGIGSGLWKKVLVIGAEALSRLVDWTDRNTCVLFGDGAGAVVLGVSEGKNAVLAAELHADGEKGDYIAFPGGLAARPANHASVDAGDHFVKMKGNEVFKYVNKVIPSFVKDVCEQAGLDISDIDAWIFHQANLRIIEGILRRLNVSEEKAIVNLQKYGNTSAASVFLALHEGFADGRISRGDKVMLVSFGAGMTYGAIILEI